MKTLSQQTLIYDQDCPLCRVYSSAFVKTGMLDTQGRMAFSESESCSFIDQKRAVNEIALIDRERKTVIYGIDSLLLVIGNSFPWIARFGKNRIMHWILEKCYRFISYNRKVIMPNPKTVVAACLPDFRRSYRITYLIFALLITGITLKNYASVIGLQGNYFTEMGIAAGQLVFQSLFLIGQKSEKRWEYWGNLMSVSLAGSLLLLPMLILALWFPMPKIVLLAYFALTALLMFLEHWQRVNLLGMSRILCTTWVVYRVILLGLLL